MSDTIESEVRIGDGDLVLIFVGPPFAEHIGARLEGRFLQVGDSIVLDEELPAFFGKLGELWRGWDGTQAWESSNSALALVARHDGIGRVLIEATFSSPEIREDRWWEGAWSASGVVTMEPSELGRVAIDLRAMRASDLAERHS